MPTTLTIKPLADYVLARDVCSYGYFLLAPNRWDPGDHALTRPLDLAEGIATFRIDQPKGEGGVVRARADRTLTRAEAKEARAKLIRMLRTDDDVEEFHRVDTRWKASGRGRLFRSPTMYEDVIRTVTNCNVTWAGTMLMNERLCAVVNPAFPRATQLARRSPASLRARCKVGYRDGRIVELSKLFAKGAIDVAWFEDPSTPDDDVEAALRELPGIGPYAAANVMQLLGRYSRLALDTESVRHAKMVLGMTGESKQIMKRLETHYDRFGVHRFRSYWNELWQFYEEKKGLAWTWDRRTTGFEFTRANLMPRKKKVTKKTSAKRRGA